MKNLIIAQNGFSWEIDNQEFRLADIKDALENGKGLK